MHGLDIIIRRNAEAAGREAAHADNDGNDELATRIHATEVLENDTWESFARGYLKGRKDG